jgi:hypothetical protein
MGLDLSDISPVELEALRRTVAYWERHWDRECPTLFGLSRNELRDVLAAWPNNLERDAQTALVALNNALNELLNGASAPPRDEVPRITGVGCEDMRALAGRLWPRLHAAIRS